VKKKAGFQNFPQAIESGIDHNLIRSLSYAALSGAKLRESRLEYEWEALKHDARAVTAEVQSTLAALPWLLALW
jgi:hypothetical protein